MAQKTAIPKPAEERYPTAELLASKKLAETAGYQRDFAKVLLTKPEYTLQEAKAVLDQFFNRGDV